MAKSHNNHIEYYRKVGKKHEKTKDKIINLKTQNKEFLYIVKVQAEELKAFYNKIRILVLNDVF